MEKIIMYKKGLLTYITWLQVLNFPKEELEKKIG